MRPSRLHKLRLVRRHRSVSVATIAAAVAVLLGFALPTAPVGAAGMASTPAGFYYGSDSYGPQARGAYPPYNEPRTGGLYGAYTAEIGTWTDWTGCTRGYGLIPANVARANADEAYGPIPGVSFYWFAAGPGADPHYNASWAEAYGWGVAQAQRVAWDYGSLTRRGIWTATRHIPLMFMDIEAAPEAGYGNGWNEVVNRCGRITRQTVIPPSIDRATFDGFTDYLHLDTIFHPGVYSTPSFWYYTFGRGSASRIPNTYEWTPVSSSPTARPGPSAFRQGGQRASWFGGVAYSRRAGWQWTQNGGDFDEWDIANLP